jgi:FdrA protein
MTSAAEESGVLDFLVLPRLYRDSVTLMALAASAKDLPGVAQVGAVMGTPANLQVLAQSEMLPADIVAAPDDLVIVVRADNAATSARALEAVQDGLQRADEGDTQAHTIGPRTVAEAIEHRADLTLAAVSTPGIYAPLVAEQALRRGLHVFCFSDNVTLTDEVRLKRLAVESGLLMMGPDCGTAIVDGVPLGFANAVRRGPVAIVAASGTGAQEVSCLLDAAGCGTSQLIGVGGRDLSAAVGGLMTEHALELVREDPGSEVVVLVSKPPAPEVAHRILTRLATLGKPAVACLLGASDEDGRVRVRGTLDGGARAVAELLGKSFDLEDCVPAARSGTGPDCPAGVLGLYTGGTLAAEAEVILGRAGVHAEIIDLGDDEFTAGRPHPMIDPAGRAERVAAAGDVRDVGILLVDLVLGHGAAPDPATPLAGAVRTARDVAAADGRVLHVVGSVCGTRDDPQGSDAQRRILRDAGVLLHGSNAAAARHVAACVAGAGVTP